MLKNQKGITLIALVITIIVLLILAGVSIAMLTGDNGLLTRANETKTESLKAEAVEKANLEAQAQYANALAGKAFDSKADIEKNLGTTTGITYEVTVTTGTSVTIEIKSPTVTTKTASVTKDADGKWKMTTAAK